MKVFFCLGLSAMLLAGCGGGGGSSTAPDCTAVVNSCNIAPVAVAGPNQSVLLGSMVQLDGTGSSDINGDKLTYSWQVINRPASSTTVPINPTSAKPTFVPDVPGIYLLSLVVNDGKVGSPASTMTINASLTNLTVVSTSYSNGGSIPIKYAGAAVGGSNVSPQLSISDVPTATGKFAIIMDDETAPCGATSAACRHWVVVNIPKTKTIIAENENLLLQPVVAIGTNYLSTQAYAGPANIGHTYNLTVYAMSLDAPNITFADTPGYNRAQFEQAFKAFVLGKATLTGTYP